MIPDTVEGANALYDLDLTGPSRIWQQRQTNGCDCLSKRLRCCFPTGSGAIAA